MKRLLKLLLLVYACGLVLHGTLLAKTYPFYVEYVGDEADVGVSIVDPKGHAVLSKHLGSMQAPYYWGKLHGLAMGTITEDPGLYLWQDNDGWHVHIAASTKLHKYEGTFVSDGTITGETGGSGILQLNYSGTDGQDINFKLDGGTFLLMTLMIDGKLIDGSFNAGSYVYIGAHAKHPAYLPVNIALTSGRNSGYVEFDWDGLDQTGGLGADGEYTYIVYVSGKDGGYIEERVTFDFTSAAADPTVTLQNNRIADPLAD